MRRLAYYPGCAMKSSGAACEEAALGATRALGFELVELGRWNCCGTVFSLADDDLMHHLGALRNLIRVQEAGFDEVVTLCAMCCNTLARVARLALDDPARLARMNAFLDGEPDYTGHVRVRHLLSVLAEDVGPGELADRVVRPLAGLLVGPYYGCTLLRPAEVGIDDPEQPRIFEDLLEALGAEVVVNPLRTECCGAYLTVGHPDAARARARAIHGSAGRAEVLVTMCPLCDFNLDARAADVVRVDPTFAPRPVVYYTQLLALALGLDPSLETAGRRDLDPRPILAARGLLEPIPAAP